MSNLVLANHNRKFDLVKLTEDHITRQKVFLPRGRHFYPSEASVSFVDNHRIRRTLGSCLRKCFFRLTGMEGGSAPSAYSEWIFLQGIGIENILVEQWKQMGIWVNNSIRFYNEEYNVSGELDAILRDPNTGELIVLEAKSYHGYMAAKDIEGSFNQAPKPKDPHLLQLVIYLYFFQHMFPYGKLFYKARDSDGRQEFDVELRKISENQTRVIVNGVVDQRFFVEDILDRYKLLDQNIREMKIPPNDFELVWSTEKIERLNSLGEIAKTKYADWQKKRKGKDKIGDYMCNPTYCPYSKVCWDSRGNPNISVTP